MSDFTRYPSNFKQDIDAEWLSRLPRYCTYEGQAPDLMHLRGLLIETARVEDAIYVGERDNIRVVYPDGSREYPWRGIAIVQYDAQGKLVYPKPEPIVLAPPGSMSRSALNAAGYTEQWLVDQARELLGETYEPQKSGSSPIRREFYNRVLQKMYGQ